MTTWQPMDNVLAALPLLALIAALLIGIACERYTRRHRPNRRVRR